MHKSFSLFPRPLWTSFLFAFFGTSLAGAAQVYPRSLPTSQGDAEFYSLRNLALGEAAFSNPALFNLYDQGASPLGLLDHRQEKLSVKVGGTGVTRNAAGDTLELSHSQWNLPQIGFYQPGIFAALLYYRSESESYRYRGSDSVDIGKNYFGFDLAAGPASGLFRIGFGAHAALGSMKYPGGDKRVLIELPSVRVDAGSRPLPGLELAIFGGISAKFDSLKSQGGQLDRVAQMTMPRYGLLVGIDSLQGLPLLGNTLLEFGTDRSFGEYRPVNMAGQVYPIYWTSYWTLQTQWQYGLQLEDFLLEPAVRFAHRSEETKAYVGVRSNQNPFKKGDPIPGGPYTASVTSFGLGGQFSYREMVSMLLEWESAGHSFDLDTTFDKSFQRFSFGLENHLERFEALNFPASMQLALRLGWTWKQEPKGEPGFRENQFATFLTNSQVDPLDHQVLRGYGAWPATSGAEGYSAFHLGLGLSLFERKIQLDGLLSFPGQGEMMLSGETKPASGMEWGVTAAYRLF